ncbi:hypothetical protein OGAPHI_001787 [Ogataea philodendri]|uniref:Peptide N-acetyl-beta-D-glucosaminyl asparaginase amidase A N-terminal domain-containing protein n=1 Tax=Ogataea philodendri TaxID=1378263 RepID=A0A9P8P961_9ASCO|nr:uncharacterized protein OGAPHI_001787 [Ogataea philodendri]KAH3668033.1 hypothetical protein OGAPHI_001787 [Ogataea philodendri]
MVKASLAREWSIWDQLMVRKQMNQESRDEESTLPLSEKQELQQEPQYYHSEKRQKTSKWKGALYGVGLYLLVNTLFSCYSGNLPWKSSSVAPYELSEPAPEPAPVTEVYEVGFPIYGFGVPVFEQHILNHTFGNSWGHPFEASYIKPNFTFNRVVVSLDTWVDGVQYDRLAHLYVDGIEVWRTSTIEPHGNLSHSHTEKDVSWYSNLFKGDATILFQLDNIVTPRLTGEFNVSLSIKYYDYKPAGPKAPIPDQVYPLVKAPADRPPLLYLPDSDFDTVVPQLSANTTRVALQLYVSGNAEEEFWYSNVLEEHKTLFGKSYPGHGPCRTINVFADGIRILSVNPFVVVYTGGISPSLWNPIVSTGAFDVKALELDVTPLLPLFWDKSTQLSIEVSNCVDDDLKIGQVPNGVGSNWIASGNVVTWEDPLVVDSTGEILSFENKTSVSAIAIAPPFSGFYTQIVNAKYSNKINSTLNYTLSNGTVDSHVVELYNKAKHSNILLFTKAGQTESLVAVPSFSLSTAKIDPVTNKTLRSVNSTFAQPLISKIGTTAGIAGDIDLEVNITKSFSHKTKIDGLTVLKGTSHENGTSNFTISPTGNHGEAVVEHQLNLTMSAPLPSFEYARHALADHGVVVYDTGLPDAMSLEDLISFYEEEAANLREYASEDLAMEQMDTLDHSLDLDFRLLVFEIEVAEVSLIAELAHIVVIGRETPMRAVTMAIRDWLELWVLLMDLNDATMITDGMIMVWNDMMKSMWKILNCFSPKNFLVRIAMKSLDAKMVDTTNDEQALVVDLVAGKVVCQRPVSLEQCADVHYGVDEQRSNVQLVDHKQHGFLVLGHDVYDWEENRSKAQSQTKDNSVLHHGLCSGVEIMESDLSEAIRRSVVQHNVVRINIVRSEVGHRN